MHGLHQSAAASVPDAGAYVTLVLTGIMHGLRGVHDDEEPFVFTQYSEHTDGHGKHESGVIMIMGRIVILAGKRVLVALKPRCVDAAVLRRRG